MILEGDMSSLYKAAALGLRCKPYCRVSIGLDRGRETWHGIMLPTYRMRYRINFPSLKNSEFQATFKFLLSESAHSYESESGHRFSERRLRPFYSRLVRLDRILTEFKKRARVPSYPAHIFAFDALYEEWGETRHLAGQYIPAFEGNRRLPVNIEEIANHQSAIMIYCQAPLRVLEHDFIHALIRHIQFSLHVALRTETQADEDEPTMSIWICVFVRLLCPLRGWYVAGFNRECVNHIISQCAKRIASQRSN